MEFDEKQLTEHLSQYTAEENKIDGAGSAISQVSTQIENSMRAASLEGVSEEERSIALKYLNPIYIFCNTAMTQYSQSILKVQGKIELLKSLIQSQNSSFVEVSSIKDTTEEAKSEG